MADPLTFSGPEWVDQEMPEGVPYPVGDELRTTLTPTQVNQIRDLGIDHAAQIVDLKSGAVGGSGGDLIVRTINFGDGVNRTFIVAHPVPSPFTAEVYSTVTGGSVAIQINVNIPNQVTIGPFRETPPVSGYRVTIREADNG